jgi:hypothetical protein
VLGTTLETVTLPDNLVARLEGKSSLGRLGLLIHSSLPGSEPVLFLREGRLAQVAIEEIVRKRLDGHVVSFDPASLEVVYRKVGGWHETAADRILHVSLASGRRIRLTGGHALFTLGARGDIERARAQELRAGALVAAASDIPDPLACEPLLDLVALGPERDKREALVRSARRDDSAGSFARVGAGPLGASALLHPDRSSRQARVPRGGLEWDPVVEVRDTGVVEPVFDLEVERAGPPTQNFLAGHGGVFVSNTAGFVDAGFSGQLTLELSNVANLPIAIYPGMPVGQLCVFQMTSPAERPYGSDRAGSKYQEQQGPTPSRYFENFER